MSKITLNETAAPDTPSTGKVAIYAKTDGKIYSKDDAGTESDLTAAAGSVSGPLSSTDNAIARFDGAGGATLQNSGITIDDSDNVSGGTLDGANTVLKIERAASLGAAPSYSVLKVLTGPPDETFISMQETGSTWGWYSLVRAN